LKPQKILGVRDRSLLIRAFNETRVGNYEFNVAAAIDCIINMDASHQQHNDFGRAEIASAKVSRKMRGSS
jgi:hypothetical protein